MRAKLGVVVAATLGHCAGARRFVGFGVRRRTELDEDRGDRARDHRHGVDLTANGDSMGDLLTFHNELFDETHTDVVGTDQGECVMIEVGVSWECR
jgi:hypothetical protein